MAKLPILNSKQIRRALERGGFTFVRQAGSHARFIHPDRKSLVTIPMHNKDIKPKTLKSIIGQSGLSLDEFLELLNR
ncbi:type II toxin-antitoxin system HicA family toxin [bacterium]|nr:type II toxin-antitoxin system HicA family toxin [bacterium]MCB9476570.1 type II toxin-antitoxin system HicA family toxin [Deltaproteobacteria bacterium]